MKKVILGFTAFTLSLSLAACGSNDTEKSSTESKLRMLNKRKLLKKKQLTNPIQRQKGISGCKLRQGC
ncbi:hypothetical protein JNA71_18685 [Bacillus halotolerans]|nr:hypothetical protein [Bacillus halotolerans]